MTIPHLIKHCGQGNVWFPFSFGILNTNSHGSRELHPDGGSITLSKALTGISNKWDHALSSGKGRRSRYWMS
ncbi:MAG: hypothetical protein BWY82_02225 [Verrucomicrobia bacterium ADurb.Bin474]|nr:MAG: hypothetical protein BWY82_02225 [Verrucomicrobia bacterium ADurb.Bin474]